MNKKQGFTLIELMIVMVIMGVLVTIGVTSFMSSQIKGRDTTRKGDLKAIAAALELYYNDYNTYPIADSGYVKACMSGGVMVPCDRTDAAHKTMTDGTSIYMANIPGDPSSVQRYWYVSSGGTQFQLYTHLENSQDAQIDSSVVSKNINCNDAGTIKCNYGVSSPDTNP